MTDTLVLLNEIAGFRELIEKAQKDYQAAIDRLEEISQVLEKLATAPDFDPAMAVEELEAAQNAAEEEADEWAKYKALVQDYEKAWERYKSLTTG